MSNVGNRKSSEVLIYSFLQNIKIECSKIRSMWFFKKFNIFGSNVTVYVKDSNSSIGSTIFMTQLKEGILWSGDVAETIHMNILKNNFLKIKTNVNKYQKRKCILKNKIVQLCQFLFVVLNQYYMFKNYTIKNMFIENLQK